MIMNFNFKYETNGIKELLSITNKETLLRELLKNVEKEFTKNFYESLENMSTNKDEHLYNFIPKEVMYPNSSEQELKDEITSLKERIELLEYAFKDLQWENNSLKDKIDEMKYRNNL